MCPYMKCQLGCLGEPLTTSFESTCVRALAGVSLDVCIVVALGLKLFATSINCARVYLMRDHVFLFVDTQSV